MSGPPDYLFQERGEWATIFGTTYIAFFILIAWAFGRERNAAKGQDRDRGSKGIIMILSFVALALAYAGPFLVPGARITLPSGPVFALAMAMFWSGSLLYFWAILTLGTFFRTSVQLLDGQQLVTSGPYRLLRHPAYTGGVLIFGGIGLAIGNWFSFAVSALLVAAAYVWRIRVEEQALHERFGAEFDAHRGRTWAIIPLVW